VYISGTNASETLNGTTLADQIYGLGGNDQLQGSSGNDLLVGGAGNDTLSGGAGADTFLFRPGDAIDKVTDFTGEDWIGFFAKDYGLSLGNGLQAGSGGNLVLDPRYFATVSGLGTSGDGLYLSNFGSVSGTSQGTASGHGQFLYDTGTRTLLWDSDGSGSAAGIALATFNRGVVLSAADFAIVSEPAVGNVSIGDVSVTEGNAGTTTVTFTVAATGGAAFTVGFATADGTATAGVDYVATSGTLSFAQGQTSQTISVTINGDTAFEPDETFFLNLTNASNGVVIADGQGLGTLSNDDPGPAGDNIFVSDVAVTEGNAGTTTATFTVSRTGTQSFAVGFATANGTATAGADYVAASGTLTFAAGEMQKTISVLVNGDTIVEGSETFFLNLMNQTFGTIVDGQGLGTIVNDDVVPTRPTVVAVHNTTLFGSPDPSGLAYVPGSKTLFLCDSEVDESPFFSANNLFALNTDGTLKPGGARSLLSFTKEPTGLAFDPTTGHMLVTDDSNYKVFWVDPANPAVKLGEFLTKPLGGSDPEDIAVDPLTGHLFLCNGNGNTQTPGIIEINRTGTQVFSRIAMPSAVTDPEALAYDATHNVFYVGGKFSSKIWVLDRSGTVLETIDVLDGFRRADGSRAKVTDLELAPSSDPNDSPLKMSLYVADYGVDQVSDGRLFEINLGDPLWA
jgi:hypothetical protein